jgi:hypothetical protein
MVMNEPIILGVRHHSPACARLVDHEIRRRRPRRVLIEGPADMNGRLDELRLPHQLPIALFTYVLTDEGTRSSWAPFCAHSPEWVALTAAHAVGADVSFIDLPGWHPAFHGVEHRFGDGALRAEHWTRTLCDRMGMSDVDAVWDHLFEQPAEPDRLRQALDVFFDELRGDEPPSERDAAREAFMMQAIACAMHEVERDAAREGERDVERAAARDIKRDGKRDGERDGECGGERDGGCGAHDQRRGRRDGTGDGAVVVVCGGYHAPALRGWRACEVGDAPIDAPAAPPVVPPIEHRHGTYLIPFSFARLDSFAGYESGMASPAYQDAVWREGPDRAGELMLARILARLRQKRQQVSAADAIAATATAEGLRRLRGHAALSRLDLLDGLAAALVKDALDAPLPWTYRGRLRPRTDPILVEMMEAISGDRLGRLAPGTPRPPLVADVRAQLDAHDLALRPEDDRHVVFDVSSAPGLTKSRLLHRLRVLEIDGVSRERGPWVQTPDELLETWVLRESDGTEGSLIEAGAYGATMEAAVMACIEARLGRDEDSLPELMAALIDAVFVGIDTLAGRVLDAVAIRIAREPSLEALGEALAQLLGLWRHGVLGASCGSALLGHAIEAAFARALWLVEHVSGSGPADPRQIEAIVAVRDAHRHARGALNVPAAQLWPVMDRRARDTAAPPALRGAALGVLWSTGFFTSPDPVTARGRERAVAPTSAAVPTSAATPTPAADYTSPVGHAAAVAHASAAEPASVVGHVSAADHAVDHATRALKALATPMLLGDFLAGLLALAREELLREATLIATLDEMIAGMTASDFLGALPSLRLAFGYLPPAEKEDLAREILRRRLQYEAEAEAVDPRDLLRVQQEQPLLVARGLALDETVSRVLSRYGLMDGEGA